MGKIEVFEIRPRSETRRDEGQAVVVEAEVAEVGKAS